MSFPILDEYRLKGGKFDYKDCDERVKIAIDIIRTEYSSVELSLDALAKRLSVTSRHLSRLFREETGTAVMDYLYRVRMVEAEKLLLNTELKIKETAYAVGYDKQNVFSRRFKAAFRLSPSEYRKHALCLNLKKAGKILEICPEKSNMSGKGM